MKTKNKKVKLTHSNYPVGDFLIRLKNAGLAARKNINFPSNKFVFSVAKCLAKEGYLHEVQTAQGILNASLVYKRKEPLISNVKLISKPGLRVYMKTEDLQKKKGPSIFILSTPKGVVSSKEAIKKKLGGEVIAEIL